MALTAEAIVGGVIGSLEQPEALILGRRDYRGRVRVAGRTTPLPPAARTQIAAVLTPAAGDHPRGSAVDRRGGAGQRERLSTGPRMRGSAPRVEAGLGAYGLASRMRLNGVSGARRIRVKPASRRISVRRASPACAPSAVRGSSVIEWATQTTVDAA
jgi:hypothetical protein